MILKKIFILFLIALMFGCDKKKHDQTVLIQNLTCEKVLILNSNDSKGIVFKIQAFNESSYEILFQSYPNEMISSSVEGTQKNGFVLINNVDGSEVKLFSTDKNFIKLPANSKSSFYLKLRLNNLNYSKNLKEDLKNYGLRYFGNIKLNTKNSTKTVLLTTNLISVPFENVSIKEVNYESLIFEKDLDTITW
jgi:predicted secreted protein